MTEKTDVLELHEELESSLSRLKQILIQELDALKNNDIAAITTLTGQKDAAFEAVEQFTATLATFLSGNHAHSDKTLAASRQRIIQQTVTCQQLNNRNGALVNQLSRHTLRSLAILRGEGESQPSTYGPDGLSRREAGLTRNSTSA